jgi:hypothetical protein
MNEEIIKQPNKISFFSPLSPENADKLLTKAKLQINCDDIEVKKSLLEDRIDIIRPSIKKSDEGT